MPKKNEPDCTQCHQFVRVESKPACTDIPQEPDKPCYEILKSLKPCWDFWKIKRSQQ